MTRTRILFIAMMASIVCCVFASGTFAQERELTPEQREALENDGELDAPAPDRPKNLPDLTQGDPAGEREPQHTWYLGPTGIVGYMVGGLQGDQVEVERVLADSPAAGKLQWGDVILGVNGKRFTAGENMGMMLGNAIIAAELEANGGIIKLNVWRDNNFMARNGKKDIAGQDIEELINKAEDDTTLYDWKPEEEQEKEVRSANFDEFPIQAEQIEVTLKLRVLPAYSDTSPYDCPKAERIREDALKVLEARFKADQVKANRSGTIQALALVASGKPEHRELIRAWVRSPQAKAWHPSVAGSIDMMKPRGFISWFMSFDALDCAVYYDATGDEFVLPALREYAVKTAMGQAGGGSWGHTFAWPSFNGGQLHGMNPGYGALNAAGNRCFMLIALAQKHGIEHPEIDLAVDRAQRFFGSYTDKGAVPYGHHGAAATDDSNAKNVGVAFSLKFLGDQHGSKYFASMSTHASFTRRGGHGDDYFWHYSPWAATLLGPKGTIATHRNLRWWFTLCRLHNGAFVIHSPTGGKTKLRDPTATYVLHYSAPMKQTLFTGKDADESMFWTDQEFDQLMASARPQFYDDTLREQAGLPIAERSTDELFALLNIFKPKVRGIVAKLLAQRYQAGEKEILPRLAKLLSSDDARQRDGACRGLAACGPDASLQYLSGLAKLLRDPHESVRIQAARAMSLASQDQDTQLAMLKATVANDESKTMSPNSLGAFMQSALFTGETPLARTPFEAGYDRLLIESALEKLITLDPAGNRGMLSSQQKVWSKETAARVAGPLVFAAEQEQIADQMFSGRRKWTLGLLTRLGYHESVESSFYYLRKRDDIPRHLRAKVYFKRGTVEADPILLHPYAGRPYLEDLTSWMADQPLAIAQENKEEPDIPLYVVIDAIKAAEKTPELPRLADEAERYFMSLLEQAGTEEAKVLLCRAELKDLGRMYYFRKLSAMRYLHQTLGKDAIADILPYLGHEHWRLSELAHRLMVQLSAEHGPSALVAAFSTASDHQAVAILRVLAQLKADDARTLIGQALGHVSGVVRGAAIQTLVAMDGEQALPRVFEVMQKTSDAIELESCEKALLSQSGNAAFASAVKKRAIPMLVDSKPALRDALYWVLAQLGGADSLAVLTAALETEDDDAFRAAVNALSYCRDPAVDKIILDTIRANAKTNRAAITAGESVRRMVVGEAGYGTRSAKEQLDYAEPVLEMILDRGTIAYLGRIRTGRCAFILQRAMRRGATNDAAKAIIFATADLTDAPAADRQLAESALIDTIEFIEVTYLRGGATERLNKSRDEQRAYVAWKAISVEAGKNLLKLSKLKKKEPLPEFDDNDLDF